MKEIEVDDAERVSDEIDRACRIEQQNTQESVDKVLRSTEKAPSWWDGICCIECGGPIPENRLKTGAFRDIDCQTEYEFEKKNHRSSYNDRE